MIAVCEAEAEVARRWGIVPDERIRIVPNGIPLREPRVDPGIRCRWGIGEDQPLVGTAGLLEPSKGQLDLLEALAEIAPAHPRLRCLVIGDGSLRHQLESRADALGLSSAVLFTGHLEGCLPLVGALDVFVLPSRWEGFPYAILEAMSLGRPVICTAVGGCPEAVEHDVTGLVVPPASPSELATAVDTLLRDPGRAASMGRAGRERVAARFSLERMIDATAAVYDELTPAGDESIRR